MCRRLACGLLAELSLPLLLTDAAVDTFPQHVGVAAVAGVLLNHVDQYRAQRRATAVRLEALTKERKSRPTDSGLCGDVAQVRVGEECPDQSGALLEPPQGADSLGFEVFLAGDAGLADPVMLDVLP